MSSNLKVLADTVRMLSAEAVEKAKSGHPGLPMGAADYATLLWSEFLRFNPEDPAWPGRDRFVLSAGHGCMLLYSLLHLFGYKLPLAEIQRFRQWDSITPGHPDFGMTPGVETTTGPLGQGFANGIGIALSSKLLSQRYSPELFDYKVYAICSDGDLMEGVASEAASLAGHLGLHNVVYFYDDNHISIGGKTEVTFTESVPERFKAYGWFVQRADGHNVDEVRSCIRKALEERERPSIICCRTTIGHGSPNKAGDPEVHGAPLGPSELEATKKNMGWAHSPFAVPEEAAKICAQTVERNKEAYADWHRKYAAWEKTNPDKAKAWRDQSQRTVPAALKRALLDAFKEPKKDATRNLSGKAIQVVAKHVPGFIGGSADLEPSNKTLIKDSSDVQAKSFGGRNLRFGVREHAMGAIVNGLAYTGCWFPYTGTFLVFSDYMRPTIRLAAISHLQSIFIFTHDSFYVGEDGPTHQPIEHVASLRLIPNLHVFRPADGMEVAMCYQAALERKKGPSIILGTRQDLPPLERPAVFEPEDILRGAYTVLDAKSPELVIVATGSEVWISVEAAKKLSASGISTAVVSMPCVEAFLAQDGNFQCSLLPPGAKKVSVEAGVTNGWQQIVGSDGLRIGNDHFGASAPASVLAEKFGFTPEAVKNRIAKWLGRN